MTLSKSVITGRFPTPDDTVASAALVKFMLSGVDSVSPDIVIPATVSVALVDGELPAGFDLWQNADGLNGTHYKVYAITIGVDAFGRNTLPGEYYLGRMTVGNSATYALADLLVVPFVEPTTADAVALCQTYAIDMAASSAATAADRVQTGLDRVATSADRALAQTARTAAETAAANAQSSAKTAETWTVLSGLTGAAAGEGATVLDGDTGTHTDPVVGGTVANSGTYRWSASPAGWRRIGTTALSGVADKRTLRLVSISGTNDLTATTDPAGIVILTGMLVQLQPVATNTGAMTVAINGGAAIPIYTRGGAALQAGQVQNGKHYLFKVAGSGASLQLLAMSALKGTGADALAAAANDDYLTADALKPVADRAENRARRLVDGRIYQMSNNLNGSVTFALTQGRVWIENNGGNVAYRVNAITATLTASQAIMVDLDSVVDGNGRLTPYVGNPASGAMAGWQVGNKLVLAAHSFSSNGVITDQIYGGGLYRLDVKRKDTGLMRCAQLTAVGGATTTDSIKIYLPSLDPESARATELCFFRQASVPLNSTIWRLSEVWDVSLSDYAATRLQRLTTGGEFEVAVLENGMADFVGGISHGNQVLTDFAISVDGSVISAAQNANYEARRIEAWQKSALYRYGTTTTKIADVDTRWLIEDGWIDLTTTITWAVNATMDRTHIGMVPVERSRASGAALDGASVQITGAGRRAPLYRAEDISGSGYADAKTTANRLITTGTGGYGFEWEALEGWDQAARRVWFGAAVSNKIYPDPIGAGAVTSGSAVTLRTRTRIVNPF